jgi:hypothetical protein
MLPKFGELGVIRHSFQTGLIAPEHVPDGYFYEPRCIPRIQVQQKCWKIDKQLLTPLYILEEQCYALLSIQQERAWRITDRTFYKAPST